MIRWASNEMMMFRKADARLAWLVHLHRFYKKLRQEVLDDRFETGNPVIATILSPFRNAFKPGWLSDDISTWGLYKISSRTVQYNTCHHGWRGVYTLVYSQILSYIFRMKIHYNSIILRDISPEKRGSTAIRACVSIPISFGHCCVCTH